MVYVNRSANEDNSLTIVVDNEVQFVVTQFTVIAIYETELHLLVNLG